MNIQEKTRLKKEDRYLIGFFLFLIFLLIEILLENIIIKHVLFVLDLSAFIVLACYHFSWITEKRELRTLFIITLMSGLILPYLFTWIHELSHGVSTLFNDKVKFLWIEVDYPYGGRTVIRQPSLIFIYR